MRSYKLHLVRHGLTAGNLEGRYVGGRTDLPLCKACKAALKNLYESEKYPRVPLVFSSPMKRCVETAGILFPSREV